MRVLGKVAEEGDAETIRLQTGRGSRGRQSTGLQGLSSWGWTRTRHAASIQGGMGTCTAPSGKYYINVRQKTLGHQQEGHSAEAK